MNKQELATKIWATANELRKNIKASEYKDYILGLGQFTRNYTQTTKRGLLTTKQAEYQAPGKCGIFSLFCCPGFPKGLSLWHTTLLAKCSVLYALSALLRKCGCCRGGQGHFYGRKAGLWLRGVEPQAQDWFHQQTGRIWMPPSLVLRRTMGQSVPDG